MSPLDKIFRNESPVANSRRADPRAQIPAGPGPSHVSPEQWVQERTRVAVGRGVNVSGKLIFHEPVRIEGYFKGEVSSVELVVVAEEATVEGRVKAAKLVILGELRGEVTMANQVVLGPRARVNGNIDTKSLAVAEGAYLQGNVHMTGAAAEKQQTA